ncbi:ALF repeat-containing protein [Streptomyces paromomycinus]
MLEADLAASLEQARDAKRFEDELKPVLAKRETQAAQTGEETKRLISEAGEKLGKDDQGAVQVARQAAVNLLSSQGTWTRAAAEDALSGSDEDMKAWVKQDRIDAEHQDDREKTVFFSRIGTPRTAAAAEDALAKGPEAVQEFLTKGAFEGQKEEYRFQILKVVNEAGKAVKDAATKALDDGSTEALHSFLTEGYTKAQAEDDRFQALRQLEQGGPMMKAAAQVALEGTDTMRRVFVERAQYRAAQADQDTAAHTAAMQAQISVAAKATSQAYENAETAMEAAARAQGKADDAKKYAAQAQAKAKEAQGHANRAQEFANQADKSAASAAASAKKAKAAAAKAQVASRQANYSATQATHSAQQAVAAAAGAQASASRARAASIEAGKDAAAARVAASQAKQIALQKHQAEQRAAAEAARKRAEEAAKQKQRPEDDAKNDKAELPGSKGGGGGDGGSSGGCPPGKQTWCDWAGYMGETSTWTGWAAAAANLIPAPGVAQGVSAVAGGISLLSGVGSSIFTGVAYGFGSDEFWASALGTTVGFVGGKFKGAVSKGAGLVKSAGTKAKEVFGDAAGSIYSGVTSLFG